VKRWNVYWPLKGGPYPHSRLCVRCRDQGFILPADDASPDTCRGHLAEDRINTLLGQSHG
jgi:hypothetical protein